MNVVVSASWCIAAAGIVVGMAALAVFRRPLAALPAMLELFTAAGLLRLSIDSTWLAIAGVVVLIAIRKVVTRSLTVDFTRSAARASRVSG